MATRRRKGTQVPQKNTLEQDAPTSRILTNTDTLPESTLHEDAELLAIKLNQNFDKVARYKSHQEYLLACLKD